MEVLQRSIAVIFCTLALGALSEERSALPSPAHALEGPELLRALRAGGLTLYFRHTATDFSQNDASMDRYEECAKQRNPHLRPRHAFDARP